MFWGMIIIIGSIIALFLFKRTKADNKHLKDKEKKEPILAKIFLSITIFCGIVFVAQGIVGMFAYTILMDDLEEIGTLQKKIKDFDPQYKPPTCDMCINIQRLTTLKERYNKYLRESKVYEENVLLSFFGPGWAISSRVQNLEPCTIGGLGYSSLWEK